MFQVILFQKEKNCRIIGDIKHITDESVAQMITHDEENAKAFNAYLSSLFCKEGQVDFEPMSEVNFEQWKARVLNLKL